MAIPARRARRALILAGAVLGCGGDPELVAPGGLVADEDLAEHTLGSEMRPAVRIEAGVPVDWSAPAGGVLRFGAGPDETSRVHTGLRVEIQGGETVEIPVGRAQQWRDAAPAARVAAGAALSFSVTGGGAVWVSDPRIESPRTERTTPLVVVVLVDTLRADHTSLDGYALPTALHLEALAADGTAFLRAYAPAPWTRPSAASLLTGLGTEGHQVTGRNDRLRDDVLTWAEIARGEGFRTVALVTNPNVLVAWGFGQGFARFIDLGSERWVESKTEAATVYRRALEIVDEESLPLFLFLHVLDPHHPYEPPPELTRRLYADYSDGEPGREIPEKPGEEIVRAALRRYDGEILDADEALGAFLEGLRERGLYRRAAIVVTGDHGEEFGERGGRYHGHTLYEEQLRVPLVLKLPGEPATARNEGLASLLDALPTVAESLGWELPAEIQGRSLLPAIRGQGPVRERLTASTLLDEAHAYALITADRKLIRQIAPRTATLLFDLAGDPEERMPRYDPGELARLGEALDRAIAEGRSGWHVRACGGSAREEFAFRIEGLTGEPRRVGFEPDDRAVAADGAVSVRVAVRRRREWGAPDSRPPTPDEDEIVFAGGRITLRAEGPNAPPTLLVGDASRPWSGPVALEPSAALRPSLAPPLCPDGERAALLAWYVEAPGAERFQPDAELRRRLEDLGYVMEPAAGE